MRMLFPPCKNNNYYVSLDKTKRVVILPKNVVNYKLINSKHKI